MKLNIVRLLLISLCTCSYLHGTREITTAQVTPDNTINTQVNQTGKVAEIVGGATRGDNLFHSFQDFSVGTGNEAWFNNANNIANIFSRVTGGNISNIDGSIRANGGANLFLINPAGIIFNENARLDIGGSFLATTAERIKFDDGEFSALETEEPILSINVPIGLGFGSNTGAISVRGESNNVVVEIPSFRVNTDNLPEVLAVKSGNNISLIGGKIDFAGGGLQAPGGRIELGSVAENQEVSLTETELGWVAKFEPVDEFEDINLSQAAYLDTSSQQAGSIKLDGRQIVIDDGSAILANSRFNSPATSNSLEINASELLELAGNFDSDSNSISLIAADVLPNSQGNGIDIELNTNKLAMSEGAQIRAINFSNANNQTGQININAQTVEATGFKPDNGILASLITNSTGVGSDGGNGNDININTEILKIADGARIKADTFSLGKSGNVNINAQNIKFSGVNPFFVDQTTGIVTSLPLNSQKVDDSGNVFINTENLSLEDGAQIVTAEVSFAKTAPAGSISIVAKNIDLIGYSEPNPQIVSSIKTSVGPGSLGDGGNIDIETDTLKILDGARIQGDSGGIGKSGNVNIKAQQLELSGIRSRPGFFVSGITTSAGSRSQSRSGNIEIESDFIKIDNGSQVRAIAIGFSSGGNIMVKAKEIAIGGADRFGFSRISGFYTNSAQAFGGNINLSSDKIRLAGGRISAVANNTGQGGNITLDTANLKLFNQAQITAEAREAGDGGNITIDSETLVAINSIVSANTFSGTGGNVQINTEGLFVFPDDSITASSELGIDGTVAINTPDVNLQKELEQSELELLTTEQAIANSCLARSNRQSSFALGSSSSLPQNPNTNYSDTNFSLTGMSSLPTLKQPWKTQASYQPPNNSLIPAEKMIETADGRIFLVAAPQQVKSLVCQMN